MMATVLNVAPITTLFATGAFVIVPLVVAVATVAIVTVVAVGVVEFCPKWHQLQPIRNYDDSCSCHNGNRAARSRRHDVSAMKALKRET
ncbi:unnamed protein product [Toxocara canis]|uniref:Transmembrane protein n=1 Tax=Toxocara canis TaxID=6265 RepID=A0A183UV81_TOXCA|nr:unnamed protein product [Toxocara canis]